jgi:RimJ/RimL family protein N-acetyltransferase
MTDIDAWPPEIATPRLRLRAVSRADAPLMTGLADDLDVARMITSIPHPFRLDDAEGFIERMVACDRSREALFAVERRGEGLIGVLGLHPNEAGQVELGYWLGQSHWGRGYMTEAVRAALDWVRADWTPAYLISGHFTDNPASGAVLCKAGFLYTGERRARFSLARDDEAITRMMIWLA